MSFPSIESGDLVRCHRYLTHTQTLKERATQLMRSRSGALVTQLGCHRLCVSASVRSGHNNVEQLSGPKQRICVQFNSPGEEECKWSRYADTTDMCENDQKQELVFFFSDTLPHSKKD